MNEIKSVLTSRTVWSGLLAMAAGIAQVYGYEFSADSQANVLNVITGVAACLGGSGAILGRIAAKKRIS
jgi:hypothetical protein